MAGKGKGSAFERIICRQLSLWWSRGESDDLFWRTAGSGARSRVRHKKGKTTKGHAGDICATDKSAQPFIDYLTPELKRGYKQFTVADVLDRPKTAKPQVYEQWIQQAREASERAGSFAWILITRRDKRTALVFFPHQVMLQLGQGAECFPKPPTPVMSLEAFFRERRVIKGKIKTVKVREIIWCMTLDRFLSKVKPDDIRQLLKFHKRAKREGQQTHEPRRGILGQLGSAPRLKKRKGKVDKKRQG